MLLPRLNIKIKSPGSGISALVFFILFLLLSGIIFPTGSAAQGDLLITPRRIVFEGSKRSMDLNLANTGKDTATYAISIVQMRMNEDGSFETIIEPDSGQRFADRFIRYFPRTVTLGPNEAQIVKIQLVRSNEMTPGEYRSHFYFRSIPKVTPLGEKEASKDSTTISVRLIPIFGLTIPAIIRNGETNTRVTLSDLSFEMLNDTLPKISMVFNRTGNMSVYGDISVDHISTQGKITRVGIANGVAVYSPNIKRRFQFNLNNVEGVNYKTGTLRVIYTASSDVKPVRLTEAELPLN